MSVLIKGGRIITAADDYVGDVFVEGERISLIGESLDLQAERVIDAAGKYVLPGCVDPHTHLDMPFGGTTTIDDVQSGQTAAAFGGTTCHVDFIIQPQGSTFADAIEEWRGEGERQAGDRHGLPHGRHGSARGRDARGARDAARPGHHLLQALHGVQGRADGRRRDALQDDGGRGGDRRARDGARRERRRDRRAREEGARGRAHRAALARAARGRPRPRARRRTARSSSRASPARRSTSSTSRARSRSSRSRSRARRAGTSAARRARSTSSSTTRSSSGPTSRARSTSTRRRRATKANQDVLWNAVRTDVLSAISTDHCAFLWDGQKTTRPRRLLEDPERRPGPREPAADDPRVRRARRTDLAEPDGRAARDEPGEAVRPVSAQRHDRRRLRRGHRGLRPREEGHDLGEDATLEDGLQPLRGHRGARARRRSCCCAARSSSKATSSSPSRASDSSCGVRASAKS